nr:YciI family protein [Thermoflexales bacterium]
AIRRIVNGQKLADNPGTRTQLGDTDMKYVLMIYTSESNDAGATPEQQAAVMAEYNVFTKQLNEHKAYLGGEALMPTSTATSVRVRDGKRAITDGPFAETKEQLGGFYIIEAPDLNGAIEAATMCPGAKYGSVELRPVMEM